MYYIFPINRSSVKNSKITYNKYFRVYGLCVRARVYVRGVCVMVYVCLCVCVYVCMVYVLCVRVCAYVHVLHHE